MNDEFWLVTTEHLEDRLWFRDGEDFKAGMDFVPIIAFEEKLFKTPKRMMYFLNFSSKSRMSKNADKMPSFKDQTIMYAVPDLCQSLFHKNSVKTLTSEELCTLSRQIRYRFSSDPHQTSRILGLTYDTISKLLD